MAGRDAQSKRITRKRNSPIFTIFHLKSAFDPCHNLVVWPWHSTAMNRSFLEEPNHWRVRAEQTWAEANKTRSDLSEKRGLLRAAEEYDRLAQRAEQWQRGAPRW